MLKFLLFAIIILLIFSILLILLIKNKRQAIQIYSLQTFLGSSSLFEDEPNEQKKSFIDTINDFFKDDNDVQMDDDHGDPGGDDTGE